MEFYEEIGSTNDVVKRALEQGCEQGFCAVSLKQTKGYGRQGRAWCSPPGGLYFSVALRPNAPLENIPTLALCAALAVRSGIEKLHLVQAIDKVQIKWPNDVVLVYQNTFRKLCGISCEYYEGGVCIGIGLNVLRQASESIQTDGRYAPGFLSDVAGAGFAQLIGASAEPFSLNPADTQQCASVQPLSLAGGANPFPLPQVAAQRIAQIIVDELLGTMPVWEKQGFAPFADKFNSCSYLTGKNVAIKNMIGGVQTQGVVCGIDAQARLMVKTSDGSVVQVIAGEAHLV
jgi:BirA family transcriptional regulator, biotin operon repressor / biotin---[acetyl-CoA-carboxylase] ligase